jgi:hypothetical protein
MNGLEALQAVNFDWVMRLDDVWRDSPYHVPEINAPLRQAVLERCAEMGATSPLGWVMLGPAGAGKTHLLGSLRREAAIRDTNFVMVDLTDVHDFWESVLLGLVTSLREPEELPQCRVVIAAMLKMLGLPPDKAERQAYLLSRAQAEQLLKNSGIIVQALARRQRAKVIEHQDTLRALLLLNSDDFILGNLGYNWLQGLGLEPQEAKSAGLRQAKLEPIRILRGLSWLMSLRGPTIMALDQLDAIVSEQHLASGLTGEQSAEQKKAAEAIVEGLARGLSALADHTQNTLCLVSCLEATWNILRTKALRSSTDRFEAPKRLHPLTGPEAAGALINRRLAPAFAQAGFIPPYPTWPFKPQALAGVAGLTPRELLKACESHRRRCLETEQALELESFAVDQSAGPASTERSEFVVIDSTFQVLRAQADVAALADEENEDELGELIQAACRCLIRESPVPDEVDLLLETQFGGGKNYTPLHARLSLVYVKQGGDELHICYRALQKTNPSAYLARLKAAMTASGIDRRLVFRRLFVLRTSPLPGGPKCKESTAAFRRAGGRFVQLTENDLRTLWALKMLDQAPPPYLEEWLTSRGPVSRLPFIRETMPEIREMEAAPARGPGLVRAEPGPAETPATDMDLRLALGFSLEAQTPRRVISLPAQALVRHTMVMAGAGRGKTALVRRLVEEAALAGLPSLVLDAGGQMARLDEPWPQPVDGWAPGDRARAEQYFGKTEVKIWTPGRPEGHTLDLPLWPDPASFKVGSAGGGEALEGAVLLGLNNVLDLLVEGRSFRFKKKRQILHSSLRYLTLNGGPDLPDLIQLLTEGPVEAVGRNRAASRLARELAESLAARLKELPQTLIEGPYFDVGEFFQRQGEAGRTRISVISLAGLPDAESGLRFFGRLAAALFGWLELKGAGTRHQLRGLLVIEEIKDLCPAGKTNSGQETLIRLAAQGARCGLGLLLATQEPRDVDLTAVAHFGNWLLGSANSPQSLKIIRRILGDLGGPAREVARLEPGQFYAASPGLISPPGKIRAPMCLSKHTGQGLTLEELLAKARPRAD